MKHRVFAMNTTPKKITKRIRKFIATLGGVGEPGYLPFTYASDKYLAKECLPNCEAESHFSGHPIIYGWAIWQCRDKKYIEAEFHAVIKRGGKLVDITPRVDGEKHILFVPDKNRIASRRSLSSWRTWTNHKSLDGQLKRTAAVIVEKTRADKLF